MVTAAMIAMFYLGTASGVMGAVLVGATRSRAAVTDEPREDVAPAPTTLSHAA